jgi:phospholipid-translocating ATPase
MSRKARTFVRGIVQKRRRMVADDPNDVEMDVLHPHSHNEAPPAPDDASMRDGVTGAHAQDQLPHWKKTLWEDLRVGDFVKIVRDESFPADILICSTSDDENVAFVETKNLDGETNLKSRNAVPSLTHLRTAADCANKQNAFRVECDRPTENMYKLQATLAAGERFPVDIQMVLLRGTVLRNTDWVIGIVLYTGADTKIVLNSGGTPSKRSKVERQMNPQVCVSSLLFE